LFLCYTLLRITSLDPSTGSFESEIYSGLPFYFARALPKDALEAIYQLFVNNQIVVHHGVPELVKKILVYLLNSGQGKGDLLSGGF
jgi:hypothetical protein